ncbi:protein TolR [Abyssibius alkaniclasticus]|uniref:protein TolR n=1 Tax=Abyssibius alkaniclasticus TaxID=2881234 RepID=UPI0023649432|nr:protein TolR [Abyssibius alkaniclasticus]UPH71480.1 protein TolR [Abyssibius alkaniclasticus]|tara:strand:+ start:1272 stop:1742 length:471 start_codon:yes stop_codon:yes gene_type:complete
MGAGTMKPESRRRGRTQRNTRRAMSEINVTPFVDVMLVLLIIFMVAAPLLTVGVPVELPRTAANSLPSENEQPLTLAIGANGEMMLQSEPVEMERLIVTLRAVAAERQDDKIFLRADGSNSYNTVMQVMGALNAAGFNNIGLVTESGGPTLDGTGQ